MNNKETIEYLRAEARKLGLTFREHRMPISGGKYYRFIKRGDSTKTIVTASSLGIAMEWIVSDCLSDLVAKLKDKDLF